MCINVFIYLFKFGYLLDCDAGLGMRFSKFTYWGKLWKSLKKYIWLVSLRHNLCLKLTNHNCCKKVDAREVYYLQNYYLPILGVALTGRIFIFREKKSYFCRHFCKKDLKSPTLNKIRYGSKMSQIGPKDPHQQHWNDNDNNDIQSTCMKTEKCSASAPFCLFLS